MLIRNATAFIGGRFEKGTDLRIMHGKVQEIGSGLCKGLYESELDLQGDYLLPGFVDVNVIVPQINNDADGIRSLQTLSRSLYRQGVAAFVATSAHVPADLLHRFCAHPPVRAARLLSVNHAADVGKDVSLRLNNLGDECPPIGMDEGSADAVLQMHDALHHLIHRCHISPENAVLMTTKNPADAIGEKRFGRMMVGLPAPLTRWKRDWEMVSVVDEHSAD